MKIREFQEYLKDRLNEVEALVNGNCRAFAEDTREVYDESSQFIRNGGVAVVVVTPDLQRNGCAKDGIPMDTKLLVRCMELPPIAGSSPNTIRALDAAEIVGHALDSKTIQFESIRQTQSQDREGNSVITATVTFNVTIYLTKGE